MFIFEVWVSCFASVYFLQRGPCRSERTGVCNALCMFSFSGKEHFVIDGTGVRWDTLCVCVQFNEENQVYLRGMIVMMGLTLSGGPEQTVVCLALCVYIIYMGGSGVPESLDGRSDRLCMSSVSAERTRWT